MTPTTGFWRWRAAAPAVLMLPMALMTQLPLGCAPHRSASDTDAHGAAQPEAPVEPSKERASPLDAIAAFAATIENRGAATWTSDPYGDEASTVRYLDQNWGPPETLWYYYADQGSRLLPYDLVLNIEEPQSDARFARPETFARYRFLNQKDTPNNPDGLPVGVTRSGDHLGLTCAACHTGQVVYNDVALRIDGAPALIDLVGFISGLEAAVDATLISEAKLGRYSERVTQGDVGAATLSLQQAQTFLKSYTANFTEVEGGFGRIDAIGGIFNQVIRFTSGTTHSRQANAPTSYPMLWDAPRHDFVQWTGFSSNADFGSFGRNTGEVVGVFGDIRVTAVRDTGEVRKGYQTSVQGRNLVLMEETLWDLTSPQWPEDVLPPIDASKATQGAALYEAQCSGCHALLKRDDPDRQVRAQVYGLDVVGTDPRAANNLVGWTAPSGILEGSVTPEGDRVYQPIEPVLVLNRAVVVGTLAREIPSIQRSKIYARRANLQAREKQGRYPAATDEDPTASLLAYKARPLNGIWASSPYLHNGSVPTLHDLLLPPDQRPKRFGVGRWTYDPVRVGYVSDGVAPWHYDATLEGNQNIGHAFGTALSEAERLALLEYLKTL